MFFDCNWKDLNHLQLGKYAEYLTKMSFVLKGFDVYASEVDDRGIDFVVRKSYECYYDIQVKSQYKGKYPFFRKDKFVLQGNLFAALVLFKDNETPSLYLIPASVWKTPNSIFCSRDYEGKKSKPEYGINLTAKSYEQLEPYQFDVQVASL